MPRHSDIVGTLGPGGFSAYRGPRRAAPCSCPKPIAPHLDEASLARGIRAGVARGMAPHLAKLRAITRGTPAPRTTDSLDDFRARLSAAAEAYSSTTFRGRA